MKPSVDIDYRLAMAWDGAGRRERALPMFRRILAAEPGHTGATLGVARILLDFDRCEEAVDILSTARTHHPNDDELHKALVTALVAAGGLARAAAFHGLVRCDAHDHPIQPQDILAVTCVRNEAHRLPYFLTWYRKLGVARFLMVDNGSSDGTLDLLLAQPDVMLWRTEASFNQANFGSAWFEVLLRQYGVGHWCLIVDADELLVFVDSEARRLPDLCRALDLEHRLAFTAILLDMYAPGPVAETTCRPGDDLLAFCPWFDRQFYHQRVENAGPYGHLTWYSGGARQRVFGGIGGGYLLSKVPLIRYHVDVVLAGGQHWTNVAKDAIAIESGALLHLKYLATFPAQAVEQAAHGEHSWGAMEYVEYARKLQASPHLSMYDPQVSVRYRDSRQLVELGVMRAVERQQDGPVHSLAAVPVTKRPFWSVMLTVYQRDDFWRQALRSVLDAIDRDAQVAVVYDGENSGLTQAVRTLAGDRVQCWCTPSRLGQPEIFNACLDRATGRWIHVLHDDDWVEESFYRILRCSIEQAQFAPVAAFCRHWYTAADGLPRRLSPLEAEAPGVIPDWLDRIAVSCRVQAVAMVVARQAYEAIGGYRAAARSAYDWDMWKRVAAHGPVWFEPTPLAYFRSHPEALSGSLRRSGVQLADAARAIELSSLWLAPALTREARRRHAAYAVKLAGQFLAEDDLRGALADLREALRLDASVDVHHAVRALLTDG